jgi:hypothetical protein
MLIPLSLPHFPGVKYSERRANPDVLLTEQVSIYFNPPILGIRLNLLYRKGEENLKRIFSSICRVFFRELMSYGPLAD